MWASHTRLSEGNIMMRSFAVAMFLLALSQLVGCATYTTPGGAVDLSKIEGFKVREAFERQPAAHFPARMAAVRVQQMGYRSYSGEFIPHGNGAYCVITTRTIETDEDIAKLN